MISFDQSLDCSGLKAIAADLGFPLEILTLSETMLKDLGYKTKLVLVRPDQHVAWRGDILPEDLHHLLGVVSAKKAA